MVLRRLVVEFSVEEASKFAGESVRKIESMDTVAFLRDTPKEIALICRVRFKNASSTPQSVFGGSWIHVQILEQWKGSYTLLLKKRQQVQGEGNLEIGAYLSTPYAIEGGRLKATFLGTAPQIRRLLQAFSDLGVKTRIISLADARFAYDSPLSRLTDKQRKVLLTSYNLGYYDLPKRISSEELAQKLNMKSSTLVIHRIKAEKKLLDALVMGIDRNVIDYS